MFKKSNDLCEKGICIFLSFKGKCVPNQEGRDYIAV